MPGQRTRRAICCINGCFRTQGSGVSTTEALEAGSCCSHETPEQATRGGVALRARIRPLPPALLEEVDDCVGEALWLLLLRHVAAVWQDHYLGARQHRRQPHAVADRHQRVRLPVDDQYLVARDALTRAPVANVGGAQNSSKQANCHELGAVLAVLS